VRRFHRPHALLQPVNQREIVSSAAKQSLTKVNVRLHKTRQYRATGGIDHFAGVGVGFGAGHGGVVDSGGRKVAVYRDEDGATIKTEVIE